MTENPLHQVAIELRTDLRLLAAAERLKTPAFRVWTTPTPTVVVGRSVVPAEEVDLDYCLDASIAVVQRPSGGRSVLIGPGTVQYTFALPYSFAAELHTIGGTKLFCNRTLRAASQELAVLEHDDSGDLVRDGRKVAGVALKRTRDAVLLHGTMLVNADLTLIERALRHPKREPTYRRGRPHRDFLANLGDLDQDVLTESVGKLLRIPA
jgi:lipoate-protein ligase A